MAEKDTCPLWDHCHQCLPGSLHMSSGEEGGSQGGFMEEVMFESGIDIYQEDRCPWSKGNGMSPAECRVQTRRLRRWGDGGVAFSSSPGGDRRAECSWWKEQHGQRHWSGKGPGVLGRLGSCVPAGLMLQLTSPQDEQCQLPLCRVWCHLPLVQRAKVTGAWPRPPWSGGLTGVHAQVYLPPRSARPNASEPPSTPQAPREGRPSPQQRTGLPSSGPPCALSKYIWAAPHASSALGLPPAE